ncbi:glucokinase [Devosia yakushimensis]|uniref:Glucokinase n=1 Tax=Devosia yakushimensis TaxID=470028 RepID=A0ABQ5UJ82_9HYPH|nr:ROK family protein [Devosia yakushimensis]GLQ10691.1 glucokinase [Devosia yakushimensis]
MSKARAIGIDIGGTSLRAALVDSSGHILAREETATLAQAGPQAVVQQIADLVAKIAPDRTGITGAGISSPGPIDTERGLALGVPTLAGWSDIPIASMIQTALNLPVRLENDAIAAAIGEWKFGAGQGLSHLVYVTISTGIGGGVIADGKVLRGRMGMAGHIGHMTIERDGAPCACGNRGCWEAYASGTAFARRISPHFPNPKSAFAAAPSGDPRALQLVTEQADWLGIGIANLLHLFSPQTVILGGGIANGFPLLLPGITHRVQANAMPAFRDVPIVPAALGENAGLIGAAAMVM